MRASLLLLSALVACLAFPAGAAACSVVIQPGPAPPPLSEYDHAVFGRITSVRPLTDRQGAQVHTMRVLKTYKGRVPEWIQLVTMDDAGACGIGALTVGRRYRFGLNRAREKRFEVNSTSYVSREEAERYARSRERARSSS